MTRDISLLHPDMQVKCKLFLELCKESRLNVVITQTFRTAEYQNSLYAQGRTKPGKIVTNAKGTDYQSAHQWGCAFDFCENVKGKEYANKRFFQQCGAIGKSLGLFWGGDFKSSPDTPHLEYAAFLPNNSTQTLKAKYGTPEKFIAVWKGAHGHKVVKAPVAAKPKTYPTLKQGSKGNDVKELQKLLNNSGAKITVDGVYGVKTTEAVKKFQKAKGLKVDGIAGNATITKLVSGK